MELLIGCGNNRDKKVKIDQYPAEWTELITLDIDPGLNPDIVHDLDDLPYPFDDNQFDEIHAYEVLEHCGTQGDWRFFFDQFQEFWRILKPGGFFCGTVPMWDSMWAWSDPGHRRIISDGTLVFLSQKEYLAQVGNTAMADYRHYWKGDFDLIANATEGDTWGFVLQAVKDDGSP